MADSPSTESIELSMQKKEQEVRSESSYHIEKEFRDKYQKENDVVLKQLPDVPKSEFVVDHHVCSHYGKIPKQGKLFITPHFILFYASILGKKVKKKIPFDKIVEISKDASTLLSVSPIEIHLKYKRFTFISFEHRDKAYNNMMLQWKANQDGRPYDIRIPLEDENEGEDESEHASLSSNVQSEPGTARVEIQSMWGSSSSANPAVSTLHDNDRAFDHLEDAVPVAPRGGTTFKGTLSKMPKLYSEGADKARSCWASCFSCFR